MVSSSPTIPLLDSSCNHRDYVADLMHLCIELDEDIYYDAPVPSQDSVDMGEYLTFISKESNRKKYSQLSDTEKQMI